MITAAYYYDDANRLTSVYSCASELCPQINIPYTWDNNGNLLDNGGSAYTYDSANRLKTFTNTSVTASYQYNGLGDRLQETVNGSTTTFTMDLNTGLTQALSDGTNTYIYGNGRIAQVNTETEYFLSDALGSVRQMTDANAEITYARGYDPYGGVSSTSGSSQSAFGFTGEFTSNNLVYLRTRHYAPGMGRFLTRDTWMGDYNNPLSLNRWMYVEGNPINRTDPNGNCPEPLDESNSCWQLLLQIENQYSFIDLQSEITTDNYWTYEELLKVQGELERYDRASKIDLSTLYPEDVKIERVRVVKRNLNGTFDCGKTYRWLTKGKPIMMYDTWAEGCLIHEMAHYLDLANLHLSKPFEKYVGASTFLWWYNVGPESPPIYGTGDPPNRREDFAESLSEYVLLYTNYSGPDIGIIPGEKRWYFIESILDTGQAPTSDEQSTCIPSYSALTGFSY